MELNRIYAIANEEADDQSFLICSPTVGIADVLPEPGRFLNGGDTIILFKMLGRKCRLLLPKKLSGYITEAYEEGSHFPLEYGKPLLKLVNKPLHEAESVTLAGRGTATGSSAEAESDNFILSPTHGLFYARPAPDEPSYVSPGSLVRKGDVLCLVEVMKCFNQVKYEGDDLPDEALIAEVFAQDSQEVQLGQKLFRFSSP